MMRLWIGLAAALFFWNQAWSEVNVHLNGLTHLPDHGSHPIFSGAGDYNQYNSAEFSVYVYPSQPVSGSSRSLVIKLLPYNFSRIEFVIRTPGQADFVPGVYGGAIGGIVLPNVGTMYASHTGRTCGEEAGWIIVHESSIESDGTINSLALDFVHYCESRPAPLFGAVRVNSSVPLIRDAPYAVAGRTRKVAEGDPVMLNAVDSFSYTASPLDYQWQQLDGPTVQLDDPTSPRIRFTAPSVPPGGSSLRFQVTVTDSEHRQDADTVTVIVKHQSDPQTRALIHSRVGNVVLRDLQWYYGRDHNSGEDHDFVMLFDDLDWNFAARATGTYGISVDWQGKFRPRLELDSRDTAISGRFFGTFYAPVNALPSNDVYFNALRGGDQFATPWIAFSAMGTGCGETVGAFQIHEIEEELPPDPYTPAVITKAAVDFVQYCVRFGNDVRPPITGSIRINSTIPLNDGIVPPLPPQQPLTIDFSLTPNPARINETVTFKWHAINANVCFGANGFPVTGALPPSGSVTGSFSAEVEQEIYMQCVTSNNAATEIRLMQVMPANWVSPGDGGPDGSGGNSKSGGGSVGWAWLLALLAAAALRLSGARLSIRNFARRYSNFRISKAFR